MSEPVPQASPGRSYLAHQDEFDEAIEQVLRRGSYILGEEVDAFEAEFAAAMGGGTAIGVANGTDALELALRGVGIGLGDAVYTVSHTAVATVAAIENTGAVPVFVDIDPERYTLDPVALADAVQNDHLDLGGARPAAVVPVHLYGQMADMPAILEVAGRAGLKVVEDCAQAHGARLHGRPAGTWGDAAAFSFYPTKNLPAFGDGGLVVMADPEAAARVRAYRQYGWAGTRESSTVGTNSRLDELQAAILRVGLRHLETDNGCRRSIAARYDRLARVGVSTPSVESGVDHVFHQYAVRSKRRSELRRSLQDEGIATAIHYPKAVHQQAAYRDRLLAATDLRVTEQVVGEILSLPMFPTLDPDAVERVIAAVEAWVASGGLPQ